MSWTAYRVVLRLTGPMHIGNAKIGNLQRTRPYVTGRVLWGALTLRLTRDRPTTPTASDYQTIGQQLHDALAMTYFYPTLDPSGNTEPPWPWSSTEAFAGRYLASYASTALQSTGRSAAPTTLHEIEQILPYTRDGAPVYLCGYIFEREDLNQDELNWPSALSRIQLGGERSYGWGGVQPVLVDKTEGPSLFARQDLTVDLLGQRPVVNLISGARLLAHTLVDPPLPVRGRVEPLVGRVWDNGDGRRPDYTGLCYLPGSTLAADESLVIAPYGIWRRNTDAPSPA